MQVGRLRKRLELQSPNKTQNAYGEEVSPFMTYATVWGSIEPLQGKEMERARQINALISHKVRIRYRSGVSPRFRIKYGERIFDVNAVLNPEERNIELLLYCTEVT
jgi:SPP1 family predicted phage head-tail adaptor